LQNLGLKPNFFQPFEKRNIVIGAIARSFDWVSQDGTIAAQVKSCSKSFNQLTRAQLDTRFQRDYLFDCLLLEKTPVRRRIFFLAGDKKLFNEFKDWSKGLISTNIEIRFIDSAEVLRPD
jgi:hypothetical protein